MQEAEKTCSIRGKKSEECSHLRWRRQRQCRAKCEDPGFRSKPSGRAGGLRSYPPDKVDIDQVEVGEETEEEVVVLPGSIPTPHGLLQLVCLSTGPTSPPRRARW